MLEKVKVYIDIILRILTDTVWHCVCMCHCIVTSWVGVSVFYQMSLFSRDSSIYDATSHPLSYWKQKYLLQGFLSSELLMGFSRMHNTQWAFHKSMIRGLILCFCIEKHPNFHCCMLAQMMLVWLFLCVCMNMVFSRPFFRFKKITSSSLAESEWVLDINCKLSCILDLVLPFIIIIIASVQSSSCNGLYL